MNMEINKKQEALHIIFLLFIIIHEYYPVYSCMNYLYIVNKS